MSVPARPLALLVLALLPGLLAAQGVTTAAIQGMVSHADGTPIAGAIVRITNLSNGRRWEVVTRSSGAYLLEDVGVGGPYRIEARAVGFTPEARVGLALALGQRLVAAFVLRPAAIVLAPLEVTAVTDPVLNSARTGPAEIISSARIASVPNPGRGFLALTTLSPHVAFHAKAGTSPTSGITIAGQSKLYNSFRIDGGVNDDLYRGALPGRETLPRPVSLEALQEIQVLPAPFDVRQGSFAGGLVNAVTRSGTNEVHGSLFGFLADDALARQRAASGDQIGDFTTWQYGANIGGPIVRNRAHYFLSVDVRRETVPDPGPLITDTAGGADLALIGISYARALRFQELLRDTFGLDPGTLGPVSGQAQSEDVFGKITVQLGTNSHLELSHRYAHGDRGGFLSRTRTFYFLSSADERNPSTSNATRVIWTGLLGRRWSNELIVSRLRLDDACRPRGTHVHIRALADEGQLVGGPQGGCPIQPLNAVSQDVLEITGHTTTAVGAHAITLGANAAALRFRDDLLNNATGQWNFDSLGSLQRRQPNRYTRTIPGPGYTGALDVHAQRLGLYVQDRWTMQRGLTLTLGLRMDMSRLPDDVATNDVLRDSLGIDTGALPGGTPHWSPRLGFNYDVRARGRTFVRGGVGLFAGLPPYQWLGNAYRDYGARDLFLDCGRARAPRFDPDSLPSACADGTGPVPRLSYFEPGLTFPQNLKVALGLDHLFPGGLVGTVDLLYTHAVRQLYVTDANLRAPIGVASGEGDRPMYGTVSASGVPTPARRVTAVGQVVRIGNASGDRGYSIALQARKAFDDLVEASLFYSYTRAWDRMSLVNPQARTNLENTPLNGTLEDRPLRTSYFEVPHRVQVGATVRLPFRASLALLYAGSSGTPYTHMIQGDANADGMGFQPLINDPIYVPRDRADILIDGNGLTAAGFGTVAQQDSVYALLEQAIEAEACLRHQRGRIVERNSCRNPWFATLNARVTKALPTARGQALELTATVYNVLNLLNSRWGQYRLTIPDPWIQTLRLTGYDSATERGVYAYILRGLRTVRDLESRWQMELSARYVF